MKKIIITSVAAAALVTCAQADFSFGEMFKDMKEAAMTLNKDHQVTSAEVSTSTNAQATAHSVSADTQNAEEASKGIAEK